MSVILIELMRTFMLEDHTLQFYFLGGPDFAVGSAAPKVERNVIGKVGVAYSTDLLSGSAERGQGTKAECVCRPPRAKRW